MAQAEFDRTKTLDELEGHAWDPPGFSSHVVTESHRLRVVPLEQFTVEDMRLLIGQRIGLPFLVPMALELLEGNPWVSGDFFPGDLLSSVLRVEPDFWTSRPDLFDGLWGVFQRLEGDAERLRDVLTPAWDRIRQAVYGPEPSSSP
jgi:hypothetical protein